MKILNEQNEEILEENLDLNLGYLVDDKIFIAHHEATPGQYHYEVEYFTFDDDTVYNVTGQDDPHLIIKDKYAGEFEYDSLDETETRKCNGINYVPVYDTEPQPEWDEYEDIKRYILYTEEELQIIAKRQATETFLESAPGRLSATEESVSDLSLIVANMFVEGV